MSHFPPAPGFVMRNGHKSAIIEEHDALESKMAHHSMLNSTFPVFLPDMKDLQLPQKEFEAIIKGLHRTSVSLPVRTKGNTDAANAPSDMGSSATTTTTTSVPGDAHQSPFMDALFVSKAVESRQPDGTMLTENGDVTYVTSGNTLVDAFFELEEVISADRLEQILNAAWESDPQSTLKIIWNARSIHLGKSNRAVFYRALGWLAQNHPQTFLINLPWLVRPLIPKKAPFPKANKQSAETGDEDFEMVEAEIEEHSGSDLDSHSMLASAEFDVKYGGSHGYWKDLLNILVLYANDQLKPDGDIRSVLNIKAPRGNKRSRDWAAGRKRRIVHKHHERTLEKLATDSFYKALHLTIARLFAEQLKVDLTLLESDKSADKKKISLAAKWAPSHNGMHDQHTFIVSSIAELLYPFDITSLGEDTDRTVYLKRARIAYQSQTLSPLRKHLDIIERAISAKDYDDIKYDRIPSFAMKRYTDKFIYNDFSNFNDYLERVASGQSKISGATMLPSTIVAELHPDNIFRTDNPFRRKKGYVNDFMRGKVLEGQWNTLVRRIRDAGTLQSSIAVCDVSYSMHKPVLPDLTTPMHSSIGLSLLVSEVTAPPFGGAIITFSDIPKVVRVGGPSDPDSLSSKIATISRSSMHLNTDFVAVFEKLILPMAKEHNLKREDMVKQVFVFSDMQFDAATEGGSKVWSTSYQRIEKQFQEAGYDMPRLIFWNLAGGRTQGHGSVAFVPNGTAPKPVQADIPGTTLVSGYSQGQMKMFMENGIFEDADADESDVKCYNGDDKDTVMVEKKKDKAKMDSIDMMHRAIGHPAYRMLKVVD